MILKIKSEVDDRHEQELDVVPVFRHLKKIEYVNRHDTCRITAYVKSGILMRFALEPKGQGVISERNLFPAMKRGSSTMMCTDDGHGAWQTVAKASLKKFDLVGLKSLTSKFCHPISPLTRTNTVSNSMI